MSRLAYLLVVLSVWVGVLQGAPLQAAEKLRVSTFSTVLTEIAERVGGDLVAVTGHVKPGVDPHEYEPTPSDLKVVGQAHVILLSAKRLEPYAAKLKQSTGAQGHLVEVGDGFASLQFKDPHDPQRVIEDPHWWQSVVCMQKATKIVRDEFIDRRPADKAVFEANAAGYLKQLDELALWARNEMALLARDKRKLVTSHHAFGYLARDYGFTLYAIEGVSSSDQPSAKKVADMIALIKAQKVKAIFSEAIQNPKVLKEITRETGAVLGGELYADGLGKGKAATYEGMYRHNISTVVNALK